MTTTRRTLKIIESLKMMMTTTTTTNSTQTRAVP
jgi:hypothetical protein